MKKLFTLFFVFAIVISLSAQKKNEFRLMFDTIELKNFNGYNYFVSPPWDFANSSKLFGFKNEGQPKCFDHINQKTPNLAYLNIYEGIPIEKLLDFVYFNPGASIYGLLDYTEYRTNSRISYSSLPNSLTYQIDTNNIHYYLNNTDKLVFDSLPPIDYSQYYKPFYFKKTEVTNLEYREFVKYVLDSLAKKTLGGERAIVHNKDTSINWNIKIDWDDTITIKKLKKFFLPEEQRFYRARRLNSALVIYNFKGKSIKIYPDTLSWINNFDYWINEPMTQMYFWHPVYDHYPVVGITHEQALAFCDWKEKQLRKEFAQKHPNIEIEVDLPSMHEWETAIIESRENLNNTKNFYVDNNYNTDLIYSKDHIAIKDSVFSYRNDILRMELYRNAFSKGDLTFDGGLHTLPAQKFDKKNPFISFYNTNKNQIHNLGNNVSEWTNVTYNQWSPLFWKRQEMLEASHTEEGKIVSDIEKHYNKWNDKNGTMIIGGNWSDERISLQLGQPLDGAYAKTFVNPDSGYCTVGFRYVIRVKLKSDSVPTITPGYKFKEPLLNVLYGSPKHWRIQLNDSTTADCFSNEITLLYQPYNTNAPSVEGKIKAFGCDEITIESFCHGEVLGATSYNKYKIIFASNEKVVLRKVQ